MSFCPSYELLEIAASYGQYKHCRAYEQKFVKSLFLQNELEHLRHTKTPLVLTDGKCFFFFSFFTLSVVRPDRPVQEREGSKNLKTEYEE